MQPLRQEGEGFVCGCSTADREHSTQHKQPREKVCGVLYPEIVILYVCSFYKPVYFIVIRFKFDVGDHEPLLVQGSVAKLYLADNGQFWSFKMFSCWILALSMFKWSERRRKCVKF